MEFAYLLKVVWPVIVAYGPAALGWLVAGSLFWHLLNKREKDHQALEVTNNKLLDTKDEYISKVQEMNDKLSKLNAKHVEIVNELSEGRIEDLKDLTADYNKLASDTLRTMDRLVVALETSNNLKK